MGSRTIGIPAAGRACSFYKLGSRDSAPAGERLPHPGVLDIRGRSDFSRFDPRPERPHFSNFGPRPRSEDLFLWSEDFFVRRRLRSDFSRFDPASPGDGPTLATLVFGPPAAPTLATLLAAWIEELFAEAPIGAGWRPRRTLAHRGPRRPTLAGLVAHLCPGTL